MYEKAKDEFTMLLKGYPDYMIATHNLGLVYREMGRYDEAKKLFEKCIKNDIFDFESIDALADAYFIAAMARETDRSVRSRLGNLAVEQMTPVEALEAYLKAKEVPEKRTQTLLDHARQLLAESGAGR